MSSIRRITDQQFSDGTTIDGDRIESALQDLEKFINEVPDGSFQQRWTQTQVVMKYLPWNANADIRLATESAIAGNYVALPYMPVYNPSTASGIPTINRARFKGNRLDYQSPISGNNPGYGANQVAWTTTLAIGASPVVIDGIDALLASYASVFVNDYEYDSSPPDGRAPNSSVDNIHLTLTLDNPFIPNIQTSNNVLWHKYDFTALSAQSLATAISPPAFSADIQPNLLSTMGNGLTTSLRVREENLRIPVPPYSQLRFSLILPDDNKAPFGTKPWQTMIPTMSLTLLERLERD
jgi:hypothetical protein